MNEPRPFESVSPEEFRRLRDIFESALDRPSAERAHLIERACGGDTALIAEVERMLRADAEHHRLLDGSALLTANRFQPGDIVATHLQIVDAIGRGGMGEVYRATDTSLGRQVAIKVVPAAFAQDAERLARFEREAKTLAALNHPHIAQIYGLEKSDGVQVLVMELVEGEDLSQRIMRGAIPFDEALPIARQIAEGLEAAHEQGIIHRDLKPANIKVNADGVVKVLDFGLAKLAEAPAGTAAGPSARSMSPTITSPAIMTGVGVLLGTAAYMSPEQARGKAADKRSDIWAFGVVLYEMLSGRRAFQGDDVSDTIAAVLRQDVDWSALSSSTPASVRRLLSRCLDRDSRRRLRDIGEARILLEDPAAVTEERTSVTPPLWRRLVMPTAAAIVAAAAMFVAVWPSTRPNLPRVTRFALSTTAANALLMDPQSRDLTITPDGTHIVYKGGGAYSTQLFVRGLEQLDPTPLMAPGNPKAPFSSPDGQWVGFIDLVAPNNVSPGGAVLKKVAITGGSAIELSRIDGPSRGATWGDDDTIILATGALSTGLQRISSDGGRPAVLTTPSRERGESDHVWPQFLPGGKAVLFTITALAGGVDASQVAVLDLATGTWKTLIRGASQAQYVSSGHLVYVAVGALWAVPFDLTRLETTGTASPVVPHIVTLPNGTAEFDVARDGTLVYVAGGNEASLRTLVWVDRQGREDAIAAPPRPYVAARLSPDGGRVALEVEDQAHDIWVWDLAGETLRRVTTDPGLDQSPVWMPDGHRLLFSSQTGGVLGSLFWQAADGTGTAERLTESPIQQTPSAVLADGGLLLFTENVDIMTLTLGIDRRVRPLVQASQIKQNAEVSPDGRWLAYEELDSGPAQIVVRPFPNVNEGKVQVSTSGGSQPLWARNGRELFYRALDGTLMSVSVIPGATWTQSKPTRVIERPYFSGNRISSVRTYDVSPDNQRFLMLKQSGSRDQPPEPASIVVVQSWSEELKRLVPVRR